MADADDYTIGPVADTDDYTIEQVRIEQIEKGDWIATLKADGSPLIWCVDIKVFEHKKAAGEPPMIGLQARPEPGQSRVATSRAPVGTVVHRVVFKR
ncbi:hypothetical protein [Mycolicibacterium pulveris]|uniref:hypothetical protein n=1 Tax=Mycolicibacterium pulveris TaxID=36813 RepID=UPI003CEFE9D4